MKDAPLILKPDLGSAPDGRKPSSGGRRSQTPFDPEPKSFWKQFWKWTGVFSLVSIACLLAYFNLTHNGRANRDAIYEFAPAVWEAKQNPHLLFEDAGSDIVNILLIGRDVNWKIKKVYDPSRKIWANIQVHDEETPARSDTMLIMSLDRVRNTIHMISLPRDSRVRLPENEYGVRRAKLNAAHAYGGPEMLVKTIQEEIGIQIHHYAVIKFEGFTKLIDQVGGVEVDVIGALKRDGKRHPLKYDDEWGNLHIDLKPGKQILNGEQAHNYVRFRMDLEGDPGRIRRQQQVMRALAKKLTTQDVWQIAPLIKEIRKQFRTDPGFDAAKIASAADFAKNIGDASKIQPLTLFGIYGTKGTLILNEPKNKKLLQYVFGPTFNEELFLHRSPSTRRDEMGEENNSSPGAITILRKAGVIEGGPAEGTPDAHAEVSEAAGVSVLAREHPRSNSSSRLAINSESTSESTPPRRRVRRSSRASAESERETATATRTEDAPQKRRSRVELSTPSESSAAAPSNATSSSSESPVPVPETPARSSFTEGPVPEAE